ncbi:MAG: aminotransferase class I/II-fold pyridoxal phosphate-dependent enzyme, partial [Gammaproteobacteria bacterium]|nr:aminotransferase class I/II-fold pyridoxal phosphate-dependent enzyme [Gammaproteobacteria bacterium]
MSLNFALSRYFNTNEPSSTLAINEQVKARWAQGHRLLHMGFGESRFAVHEKLHAALCEHASQKSYLPSKGDPALCASVASYYNIKSGLDINASQVIIGPGSKALIYAVQLALGADLFLPTPSWVSYAPQARLLGLQHFYIPQGKQFGCHFELAALDELIRRSTNDNKLLIINSPNNPTGQMYPAEFLQALADYCRQHKILVISDEIYG